MAEKAKRTAALATFTRNERNLQAMLDEDCPKDMVTPQFEKVQKCWDRLEETHDMYIETIVGEIELTEQNKLDEPNTRYQAVLKRYSTFIKAANNVERDQLRRIEAENQETEKTLRQQVASEQKAAEKVLQEQERTVKFESSRVELATGIDAFSRFVTGIELSLVDVSESIKRSELAKVEAQFNTLQTQLVKLGGIDFTQDISELNEKFANDAEKTYFAFHKKISAEIKDAEPSTSGGSTTSSSSSTKKEHVDLPDFSGDEENSPFIKFPTWLKQWELQILEFPEKYRSRMLEKHLDDAAKSKFIGYEGNYEESMKRLTTFYGDRQKVVKHVLNEVLAAKSMIAGDYKSLISYSVTLENNYARLMSLSLEHELSNTSIMSLIVKKFPRAVCEKWHSHLISKTDDERAKPFPLFIQWLITEKAIWECMVSSDVESSSSSFFVSGGGSRGDDGGDDVSCYICGEKGHISRFCPTKDKKRPRKDPKVKKYWCALHKDDKTTKCHSSGCQDLRKMQDKQARVRLLKENGDCTHCCGDHKPADCRNKERVCGGGKPGLGCQKGHKLHELFCADAKICLLVSMTVKQQNQSWSVVLLIMQVPSPLPDVAACVLFDTGSSVNFITETFAEHCGFSGQQETLSVTTLGGVLTEFMTVVEYNCKLKGVDGKMIDFKAYGIECITGRVSPIGYDKLRRFFPQLTDKQIHQLQRTSNVDVLIGLQHASLQPQRTVQAKGGGDFWLHEGPLGACVGGRHPQLREETCKSSNLFQVNHHIQATPLNTSHELEYCPARCEAAYHTSAAFNVQKAIGPCAVPSIEKVTLVDPLIPDESDAAGNELGNSSTSTPINTNENINTNSNPPNIPTLNVDAPSFAPGESWHSSPTDPSKQAREAVCNVAQALLKDRDAFFQMEALGTVVEPKCGGCRCGSCPVAGSKFSFREQRQYDKIQKNLFHDKKKKRWTTSYPWKCERSVLPRNKKSALKQLHCMEKSLLKRRELAEEFCQQIENMVTRGAAVVLSEEELEKWEGDYHYLPLVGVKNKKSLRVCFDFARKQCGAPSFNDCLDKGPDRFVNNLLAVILGFRNGRVGCVADIAKFHNQVHLVKEDMHMQRFLWRNMQTDEPPKTYAVPVNNFGASPANCIATCALRNTAEMFADIYPVESKEIQEQTYIDDELTAAPSKPEALIKTQRWDEIKAEASMPNKGWMYSGDDAKVVEIGGGELDAEKVLGLAWDPKSDTLLFRVKLRIKRKSGEQDIEIDSVEKLHEYRELILTRRVLQSNILSIFDPAGLLTPIILQSKLLLRESWLGLKPLGWDDVLPEDQGDRWITFLSALLSLGEVRFPRSIWPEEEVVGLPILIVFSDGSLLAYGAAAYIRWKLKSGGYWTRLIMAKSKIGAKDQTSVPRQELNGTVVNNRVKLFLVKETNLEFSAVYQVVDSSTVLGYLHKESGVYKPYEGVRVAEVQSSNEFEDVLNTTTNKTTTRLKNWAWVAGKDNPADMCTKPRPVHDLEAGGDWQVGPAFLREEISEWPIKHTFRTDRLDGEIVIGKCCHVSVINVAHHDLLGRIVNRVGSWKRMKRVLAWILRLGTPFRPLLAVDLKRAKHLLLEYAQKDIHKELKLAAESGKGRFRRLAPVEDETGLFRAGSRIRHHVPFTFDAKLPVILPTNHILTLQIMRASHNHAHVAADGTLCRFRMQGYWSVKAGVIAKKVANACVDCRKKVGKTLSQPLGEIPAEQLKDPMAWGQCQMDIFGPYHCRSDVNARSTKKIWGLVLEDVNSGAVHIDVISDYSTNAVLMTLRRFGSLRGWPSRIQSDPGSQLESASGKLDNWWSSFGDSLQTFSSSKNFEWTLSPPDSPWRQGKAERRIGVIKNLLRVSVGDTRVTPLELQTIFMEISNICNERPIGVSKPRADGSYAVLTPNHLLMGRSSNILPDDAVLAEDLHYSARYRLVNHVTTVFWSKWCSEVTPRLVFRQKWHVKDRNLRVDDIVMISESSPLKAKYKLAVVESVHTSNDGSVRSATVRYTVLNNNRSTTIRVQRSVQRLVLILPVEEQDRPLKVREVDTCVKVEGR